MEEHLRSLCSLPWVASCMDVSCDPWELWDSMRRLAVADPNLDNQGMFSSILTMNSFQREVSQHNILRFSPWRR